MNGGWGVGWTVELKLNGKKRKKLDSNGDVATRYPPLDPPLMRGIRFISTCILGVY